MASYWLFMVTILDKHHYLLKTLRNTKYAVARIKFVFKCVNAGNIQQLAVKAVLRQHPILLFSGQLFWETGGARSCWSQSAWSCWRQSWWGFLSQCEKINPSLYIGSKGSLPLSSSSSNPTSSQFSLGTPGPDQCTTEINSSWLLPGPILWATVHIQMHGFSQRSSYFSYFLFCKMCSEPTAYGLCWEQKCLQDEQNSLEPSWHQNFTSQPHICGDF